MSRNIFIVTGSTKPMDLSEKILLMILVMGLWAACAPPDPPTRPKKVLEEDICSETDAGRQYEVLGAIEATTVYGMKVDAEGVCRIIIDRPEGGYVGGENGTHLMEWSCDLEPYYNEIYLCPNGCRSGACV